MSLHRAAVFAVVLICGVVIQDASVFAATTSAGTLSLHATTIGVVENNGSIGVMVIRTGGASGAASVQCRTANNTAIAGHDYTAVSTTIQWANGDSAPKNCTVPISDATPFSGTKTFFVQLSAASGASLGTANKATVTIYGNLGGGKVSMSTSSYSTAQSAGHATVTVNRVGGSIGTAVVSYATANATAIAGTDYTATSGMLLWQNGDATPKSFTIPISTAKAFTGTKSLSVALSHPEDVVFGTPTSAIVTISGGSSTAKPTVSLTASPSNVLSGGTTTLNWSSSNATACSASGGWTGSQTLSGSKTTGALTANQAYTLTCTGSGGSTTQSASVAVNAPATTTPAIASCTGTSGALNLNAHVVRSSGISPFLVFFDATGTTDSALKSNTTAFQDVTYTWNFGDSNASGTDTWNYGANHGRNSRNTASGGVAAHLYITPGTDSAYTVTVTARDGTNTASCQLGVTAHDPAGANGFAGSKTTCVSASGTPTPGSGGCPAGAATLQTSSFNSALGSFGGGKRVLFKCGDTFSGSNVTLNGVGWSIGAYGGCEGTQSGRPIFSNSTSSYYLAVNNTAGDGRVADIDFEGNGSPNLAINSLWNVAGAFRVPYQITLSNLRSNGNAASYAWAQGAQWGLIDSVQTGASGIGTFVNYNENNPPWAGSTFANLDYQALLGNSIVGIGGTSQSSGVETVRVSACRMCAIENNSFSNANGIGALLKFHNGNTYNSLPTWTGVYTELSVISDNLFTGTSGAQLLEVAPQNGGDDERMRNILIERNLFAASTGAQGGRQAMISAVNVTLRDNVFYMPGSALIYPILGAQIAQRGVEPIPSGVEVYNNTCYAPNNEPNQSCIGFDTTGSMRAGGINSYARNNLFFVASASGKAVVDNTAAGNTISNNSSNIAANPGFTNGSGTFNIISDFTPTANYSGAMTVPAVFDALGAPWSPTWDLGAIHH